MEDSRNPAVSAIIPAFNEGGRVGEVVRVALESGVFSEVIVVDDGSDDTTFNDAKAAGATVIRHDRNKGKPAAMKTGFEASVNPVICFLDADLLSINRNHIFDLVNPVISGNVDASLAVFKGGRLATSLAQRISPMISGQRCIRRKQLERFEKWDSGFGIETAINDYLQSCNVKQLIVDWPGAAQRMKEEKRGFLKGFASRLVMFWQIFVTWISIRFTSRR